MKKHKLIVFFIAFVILVSAFPQMGYAQAATVAINKTKTTIEIGETTVLTVSGTDSKVSWKSSNTKIATVSSNGKVKGIAKGTAKVTATVDKKKYTCTVTVKSVPLAISKKKATMEVDSYLTLRVRGTVAKTTWKSDNTDVATVTTNGTVTAIKPGVANITGKVNKKKYTCKVTVVDSNVEPTPTPRPKDGISLTVQTELPKVFYDYNYNNKSTGSAKITGVTYKYEKLYDGTYQLTCVLSGEIVSFDRSQDYYSLSYILYDSEGYVVKTDEIYRRTSSAGEKFKNMECVIFDLPADDYTIVFYDTNGTPEPFHGNAGNENNNVTPMPSHTPTPTPTSSPKQYSEQEKYEILKKKADAIAFSCAETVLRGMLKNPSSMTVLDEEIRDSDEYFRYYIVINYSATNSFGGVKTDKAYVLIRVNPKMDGTFYYAYNTTLGINYVLLDSEKEEWGWGTEPSDWSLDAVEQYIEPTEVSLKLVLASPNKYKDKYVKITEELVVSNNYLSDKKFWTYQSTGSEKYSYNTNNHIDVFYRFCNNVDDCIMLDADYQKITVCGYVKSYSNSTEPYIDAYEIVFE